MPKPVKRRPIPDFSSEDQEREFWAKEDSSKYIDWSQAAVSVSRICAHRRARSPSACRSR